MHFVELNTGAQRPLMGLEARNLAAVLTPLHFGHPFVAGCFFHPNSCLLTSAGIRNWEQQRP